MVWCLVDAGCVILTIRDVVWYMVDVVCYHYYMKNI